MTQKTGKNRYLRNARILDTQFRAILREFCLDSTAAETATRVGVNRKTVNRIFYLMRQRLITLCFAKRNQCSQEKLKLMKATLEQEE